MYMNRILFNTVYSRFKDVYAFETRKLEASRVIDKYPSRIPIICEKLKSNNSNIIDKNKYLVPMNFTCAQFIYVIRQRVLLPYDQGIYLVVNGTVPQGSQSMIELYNNHKDKDGFLYINYTTENVFG